MKLRLHALAYNFADFLRTLALPRAMAHWPLTTLRKKLVEMRVRMICHGRCITFQLGEVNFALQEFGQTLARIVRLRMPPVPA